MVEVKREEIIGKPILIFAYDEMNSKYNDKHYAIVHAMENQSKEITFIANWYMLEQLKKVELPVMAIVRKRKSGPYFEFVTPVV